MEKILEQ
jgi:hypothetical protein